METEVWKTIPGFDNYKASNLGRVRRVHVIPASDFGPAKQVDGDLLKATLHHSGYLIIGPYAHGKQYLKGLHQLVMLAFVGEPPEGHEVLHGDGNKLNCRLGNLSYGTSKQNAADRDRHGTTAIGERNGNSKLSDSQVAEIRNIVNKSYREIGKIYSVSPEMISYIIRGMYRK